MENCLQYTTYKSQIHVQKYNQYIAAIIHGMVLLHSRF